MSHLNRDFRQYIKKKSKITVQVAILVKNKAGEILLQQRAGAKEWGLPFGSLTPGESLEDAARRELWEETSLTAKDMTLLSMFSGPEFKKVTQGEDEEFFVIALYEAAGLQSELNFKADVNKALRFFGEPSPPVDSVSRILLERLPNDGGIKFKM
ncbi:MULTISPECIES: NUDIX domain-containing protein [Paenibacillus]|uniref:NUDIX hydrolase n=1 Tax=Paenibacillus azoreducens TaxID=116718 RepID=A0A919YI89_9BACL|nr:MULTISPECIES: NUDIX domain-containing protein [Paenibacillus]MBE9913143.1 NUDIX domain-containing protein [Paenibacillus donghaensis]GIO49833.1 NUDIX hydrolase [Paenibacillus azoreducens]